MGEQEDNALVCNGEQVRCYFREYLVALNEATQLPSIYDDNGERIEVWICWECRHEDIIFNTM